MGTDVGADVEDDPARRHEPAKGAYGFAFEGAEDEDEIDSFPRYGDTMRVEAIDDTTVRFIAVHERGPYRHHDCILARSMVAQPLLKKFLAAVVEAGGHWERHCGGWLFVAVPEHVRKDIPGRHYAIHIDGKRFDVGVEVVS